jgi:SAM-dependent methyltransferase
MTDADTRTMQLLYELHSQMPRQGPGGAAYTRRAFTMLTGLPPRAEVLDVGCGPGAQTLTLAMLDTGTITAVDNHAPYLAELEVAAEQRGLTDRIRTVEQDMTALDFPAASVDLIWSEGAIYIMGFETGLRAWRPLLRDGGFVAVTEATWLEPDPPAELAAFWDEAYPAMQNIEANLATLRAAGYRPLGHFTLPDSSWWTGYYIPLEARLAEFERHHQGDASARQISDMERREIALFRKYSRYYGYVFYVMRRES